MSSNETPKAQSGQEPSADSTGEGQAPVALMLIIGGLLLAVILFGIYGN